MGATFTDLGHVQGQKTKIKKAKAKLVGTMTAAYFSSSIKHMNQVKQERDNTQNGQHQQENSTISRAKMQLLKGTHQKFGSPFRYVSTVSTPLLAQSCHSTIGLSILTINGIGIK